jgi:hypothetical protein
MRCIGRMRIKPTRPGTFGSVDYIMVSPVNAKYNGKYI